MRNYTPVPVCCVLRRLLRRASAPSLNEGRIRKREARLPSPISLATLGYSLRAGLGYDGDRQLP